MLLGLCYGYKVVESRLMLRLCFEVRVVSLHSMRDDRDFDGNYTAGLILTL